MNENIEFKLRLANSDDALPILAIRNSEAIRNVSFNTGIISEEEHIRWFNQSLQRDDRWILVAESENKKLIGILRYDVISSTALEVSIFLNPGYIGRGIGCTLLAEGNYWVLRNIKTIQKIEAKVLSNNIASNKTFKKGGFVEKYKVYELDIL